MDSVFGENGQSTAYDSTAEWEERQDMSRGFMFHTGFNSTWLLFKEIIHIPDCHEEVFSVEDVRTYLPELTFFWAAEGIREVEPLINLRFMPWYGGQDRIKLQELRPKLQLNFAGGSMPWKYIFFYTEARREYFWKYENFLMNFNQRLVK